MAIKKTINTVHGIEVLDAYHRVESVSLQGKDAISFHLRGYADPNKPFVAEQVFSAPFDLNGTNPIAQAYAHIKTLPDFEGSVDC